MKRMVLIAAPLLGTGLTCHEILNGFGSECSNF